MAILCKKTDFEVFFTPHIFSSVRACSFQIGQQTDNKHNKRVLLSFFPDFPQFLKWEKSDFPQFLKRRFSE